MSYSGRRVSVYNPKKPSLGAAINDRRFSTSKEPSENEQKSEVHKKFRERFNPHPGLDQSRSATGVIWCTDRASEHGFLDAPLEWANLGQGAPEAGDDVEGCAPRPKSIPISEDAREYGPTAGIKPLREAVAKMYNAHHRKGKESQYTYENVCIVPGGRAGLIRIAAVLGNSYLAFFIPDYTAYNEMLGLFKNFAAIPVPLSAADQYHIHADKIAEEIARGASVILTSNPRNPTGCQLSREELSKIQDICRDRATLILDEFYTGYTYASNCDGTTGSGAEYVEDVDRDDTLLIDGMTKRFRLPGWRVAWVVGPKEYIKALAGCGSYLDGGCNVAFQEAAIPFLEPDKVTKEMSALQVHFKKKRDYVLERLHKMGYRAGEGQQIPDSTFYIWLDLTTLTPPLPDEAGMNDGLSFFDALLKEKTIVVPGIFFDLNPSKRRDLFDSPCHHFVRISYGPKMKFLERGMNGIENAIKKARESVSSASKPELKDVVWGKRNEREGATSSG